MTDPVARDKPDFAAIRSDLVLSWGHLPSCGEGAEYPWDCTCDYRGRIERMESVIAMAERAGVLPPDDVLAKVRAEIEALPSLLNGGLVEGFGPFAGPGLVSRAGVLAILDAALSPSPEVSAPEPGDLRGFTREAAARIRLGREADPIFDAATVRELIATIDNFIELGQSDAASPPAAPGLPAELRALSEEWADDLTYEELRGVTREEAASIVAAVNFVRALAETPGAPKS